jgi:hypothetical protein
MRNFTYWVADSIHAPSRVYSLRAKTRREVLELIDTYDPEEGDGYEKPRKVTIPYADTMDLVIQVAGEGFNG